MTSIVLNTPEGPVDLDGDTLVTFVDETGHEQFRDARYPVFGLGGCAVLARDYQCAIETPWTEIKATHFGGATVPLHASELPPATPEALDAVGNFFRRQRFYRVAVVCHVNAELDQRQPPYAYVAGSLCKRVENVLQRTRFSNVAFIFEKSERAGGLAVKYFGDRVVNRAAKSGTISTPIRCFVADKGARLAGLEVADFIMHAAGTRTRERAAGRGAARRDFIAVFRPDRAALSDYLEITRAELQATPPPAVDLSA